MDSNQNAKEESYGSNKDARDDGKDLNFLLLKAVNSNDLKEVQKLIARGVDINKKGYAEEFNYTLYTPLTLAAEKNYVELSEILLCTENINVNEGDNCGYTALHKASCLGHVEIVEALLKKKEIDVNSEDSKHASTPLHLAARLNREEVVEKILKVKGVLVNKKDKYARTALHECASRGHEEVTELLLNTPGILVNEADNENDHTALHLAADFGHSDVVEALLKHPEIDVNAKDKYGQTPLHTSAHHGYSQVVDMLLKSGIDAKVKTNKGLTAVQCAAKNGQVKIVETIVNYIKGVELPKIKQNEIKDLSQSMKNVAMSNVEHDNETKNLNDQLLAAAKCGDLDKVEELLKIPGADVNCNDRYLNTPLHLASEKGHSEIVKALLRIPNIEVNAKNKDATKLLFPVHGGDDPMRNKLKIGKTALHLAVAEGHLEIVKELLSCPKTDVNAKDKYDTFPLLVAVKKQNLEVAEVLLSHPDIDVNAVDTCNDHFSLLHIVSENGSLEMAKALLKHPNINLNLRDKYYRCTPLELAVKKKREEIVKAILYYQKVNVGAKGDF